MKIYKIETAEKITFYNDRSFYLRCGRGDWYKLSDAFSSDYIRIANSQEIQKLEKSYHDFKREELLND